MGFHVSLGECILPVGLEEALNLTGLIPDTVPKTP